MTSTRPTPSLLTLTALITLTLTSSACAVAPQPADYEGIWTGEMETIITWDDEAYADYNQATTARGVQLGLMEGKTADLLLTFIEGCLVTVDVEPDGELDVEGGRCVQLLDGGELIWEVDGEGWLRDDDELALRLEGQITLVDVDGLRLPGTFLVTFDGHQL